MDLINTTVITKSTTNGAFIASCKEHCGQWGTNQTGPFPDFRPVIDGLSQLDAFVQWRQGLLQGGQGAGRRLWIQQAPYPCDTCCQGGQN